MVGMAQVAAELFRVCLIGPESTGKSALAARLAAHFTTVAVPEYAREYALRIGRELTYDDVTHIGAGQLEGERRLALLAHRLIILDTDLLSTVVYSSHHYGRAPQWIEEHAAASPAQLYLLLDIDVPWLPDPARSAGQTREALFSDFRRALETQGARYEVIRGNWEEREHRAIEVIDRAWRTWESSHSGSSL
jgi:NadR type nicotinamide-nucleotide adenylyltransferase